ncbi:hypothetical protein CY35_17G087600 [Sphagnum magellanicum]|nr:hypothetical protein CY35_17G087600 [Sphagnum magellanicum]
MVSGVEEEGTRRGTTMCDAIERHCSGVEQAADPEDLVSGVEEPAGEEEETHEATASAALVSRVEEEGSRQGTTSDDIIASHISGAEEAAPEVPVYSVEQADGDGPTSDEGNEIRWSGAEEIDRSLLFMRQRTSSDVVEHAAVPESPISGVEEAAGESDASTQYFSGDEEVARTGGKCFRSSVNVNVNGRCTFQCVKMQENRSGTCLDYKSPVRSLIELEEAVEECNSIHLPFGVVLVKSFDIDVPELVVTEELIKLLMRINKNCVKFQLGADQFLQWVFDSAWGNDVPNSMKLAVGMVKSSVVCPMSPFVDKAAMDSAFMSCHTMPQLLKMLLEFNPNFEDYFWPIPRKEALVMKQEYKPNFFPNLQAYYEANYEADYEFLLPNPYDVVPKDEFQCYSQMTNSECTLQNLTNNQWKLDAHVTGLKSPWSKNFNQTLQKIELEVLMEPSVLPNNSLTLKILNLKFYSDNAGSNASAGILSRFFLSGVALTATPEVDPQHFMSTKLGLGSPNPAHDMLVGTTSGTTATIPLGKGVPTVGFTSTQTNSLTSKSVSDWEHEQTHGPQNCHSSKSGTFSWTLKNLGGIPFDFEKPSYPRNFKKSRLQLPFNKDGSVTFTDKEYPDPITWSFKPELQGMMVAWRISMEVYVTILNSSRSKSRSTSAGQTLKFCFARHLQHKLSMTR